MPVYRVRLYQTRVVAEDIWLEVNAASQDEVRLAATGSDLYQIIEDLDLEWSEICSKITSLGPLCIPDDEPGISEDDIVDSVRLVVSLDEDEDGETGPVIVIIPPTSGAYIDLVRASIDNDSASLAEVLELFRPMIPDD